MLTESLYYHEFDPTPALAGHVASFWGAEVRDVEPGHLHQVIPDGCVGLVASRRADGETRLTLQGPRLDPLWIPVGEGDRFWGVRFWPDAGGPLLGRPPRSLLGVLRPPDVLLGFSAVALGERLGELRGRGFSGQHLGGGARATGGALPAAGRRRAYGAPGHRGGQGRSPARRIGGGGRT